MRNCCPRSCLVRKGFFSLDSKSPTIHRFALANPVRNQRRTSRARSVARAACVPGFATGPGQVSWASVCLSAIPTQAKHTGSPNSNNVGIVSAPVKTGQSDFKRHTGTKGKTCPCPKTNMLFVCESEYPRKKYYLSHACQGTADCGGPLYCADGIRVFTTKHCHSKSAFKSKSLLSLAPFPRPPKSRYNVLLFHQVIKL